MFPLFYLIAVFSKMVFHGIPVFCKVKIRVPHGNSITIKKLHFKYYYDKLHLKLISFWRVFGSEMSLSEEEGNKVKCAIASEE
jgi:hypothetical protein